ncbi:MAG: metal ABC transporter permease [Dehalococcoidia bacterium]|jgi:zinc transport system permease protein|nr:metal ABC transporter permease [Dehalococcoidia bacterium]
MPSIFEYEFMVRALIGGAMVGALAPALGMFLVLRRFALIADTLSHVAFMGVAIGLFTKTFPPLVALGATSITAVAIDQLRARRMMPGDAALAVFLYAALAIAVVVISLAGGFNVDLFSYLFGSVLTISPTDLWLVAGLMVVIIGFVGLFFSELAQSSFDSDLARTSGVPVGRINLILAVLTGATITLSMRIVGVLLVGALIVIPVIASLRLATGLRTAVILSMAFGVSSSLLGLTIAYYANVAAGGAVVLTAVELLILVEVGTAVRERLRRGQGQPTNPSS